MILLCKAYQPLLPFFPSLHLLDCQCNLSSSPALLSLLWVRNGLQAYLPRYTGRTSWRADLIRAQGGSENSAGGRERRTLIIKCHRKVAESSAVKLNSRYSRSEPLLSSCLSAFCTRCCCRHFTSSFILEKVALLFMTLCRALE